MRIYHRSLRFLAILLVLSGVGCGSSFPDLQEGRLDGDDAVIERFEGRWYRMDGVLMIRVRSGNPGSLALRFPEGYRFENARSVGEEIHYDVVGEMMTLPMSIRFLGDDVLVLVRPGEEPSWCGTCTPRLQRLSEMQRLTLKLDWLKYSIEELPYTACAAYDATMGWLAQIF